MTNTTRGAERLEKHASRLAWLRDHPQLLAQLPGARDDVDGPHSEALDAAVRGLQLVRLYAPRTEVGRMRWGIRLAVSEIRGEALPLQDRRWALRGRAAEGV